MHEKIKGKYIVKKHKTIMFVVFVKGQVWELENHFSKEPSLPRERYTLSRDDVTVCLSEDEFKDIFDPCKKEDHPII